MLAVLHHARDLGFLGPGRVKPHLRHALAAAAAAPVPPLRAADLGSGGGLPGLPLALLWPESTWVLIDAHERRTAFLEEAATTLGLGDRVTVRRQRAEEAGRDPDLRGAMDLVVARSFGPPPVTAECAAPLLRVGGRLVVADPPAADPTRWPVDGVALLGLVAIERIHLDDASFQILGQESVVSDRYPRRVGIPAKRPLW